MDLDQIPIEPDKIGPYGRAWRVDIENIRRELNVSSEHPAIVVWLIEAPWAHPLWHSYYITLYHLRPLAGAEQIRHFPDASHEIHVYALDPKAPREPQITSSGPSLLSPVNFMGQFQEHSDATAQSRAEGAIDLILTAELSPDSDCAAQWFALFGDALVGKRTS